MKKKERVLKSYENLMKKYPDVGTFLDHKNEFELLIAVILSAQCTDARVNIVTPTLFKKFPTPKKLGTATFDEVKETIKSINFFNNKTKNIIETGRILWREYNSNVPNKLEELIKLPGVGRKTANVVLGQAFNIPGITVDTHVGRVSRRLGFTKKTDAVAAEKELMEFWPIETWIDFSSIMILHGRETCSSQRPKCKTCIINNICPEFKKKTKTDNHNKID